MLRASRKAIKMSLVAGGKGTCYIAWKVWQCSPVVTWKIGCVPNKCDDLAKEISRQRIVEGSAWILPVAYKKNATGKR